MRVRAGAAALGLATLAAGGCLDDPATAPVESATTRAEAAVETATTPLPTVALPPALDLPLSVEEAYAAIPHRRTRFRFETSPLPDAERHYLEAMFHLIEQGTRLRVVAWRDLYHGNATNHDPLEKLTSLIQGVDGIEPPPRLAGYHQQVRSALVQQRRFFQEWLARGPEFRARAGGDLAAHPAVQASSLALRTAYGILMRELAGGLAAQERNAFFDYHCALDFL